MLDISNLRHLLLVETSLFSSSTGVPGTSGAARSVSGSGRIYPSRSRGTGRLESDHERQRADGLIGAQVGPPESAGTRARTAAEGFRCAEGTISKAGVTAACALVVRRIAVIAAGRRNAAVAGPVGHVGVAIAGLRAEGDELAWHIVDGDGSVVHLSAVPAVLGKVRGARDGRGAVDGRQQCEVTAGVVHLPAAQGQRITVLVEPEAQVAHPAYEFLLGLAVGAIVAVDAAGVG